MHPIHLLAGEMCQNTSCPAVHATARDTVLVQGRLVDAGAAGMVLGEGETIVEIPSHLIIQAAGKLQETSL